MLEINDVLYRANSDGDCIESRRVIEADNEREVYVLNTKEKVNYVKEYDYFQSFEWDSYKYFKTKEQAIRHQEIMCENRIKYYEEQIKEKQTIINKLNLLRGEKKPIEEEKPREKRKPKPTK